uniref:Stereocilin LRR domain-containing protein n=1 Tax=Hucho hucho TaxID=62062 RepID=A0A4W5MP08_9TELE
MGSLKTLGLLPSKSMGLPSLQKPVDRHRLSGFLYNISMYLQEMGAELEERQLVSDEEQLWEKVLQSFIQSEGGAALNQWDSREPPRPSVRLQDWFLSLRGSPHWDGLLGLLQSLMSLSERQPHRPLLDFLSQNWRTVSALLEAALQALVSGTYGQASAGLQGFICALRGRSECAFSVSWLTQFLRFMETRNWKPVVNLHPAGMGANQRGGSAAFGAGQLAEQNPALLQGLDGLRRGFLHRVGSSVYGNLRRKVSRVTMALLDDVSSVVDVPQPKHKGRCSVGDLRQLILWGIRHNVTWNAQALGFNSQGPPSTPPFLSCPSIEGERGEHRPPPRPSQMGYFASAEILEAACNASIPGLTEVDQVGPDLHATCSDAAWYLSAAEDDFLWVHVCSEFFAHQFNNTVCANSSFWLQRSSIGDLCVQLSGEVVEDGGSPGPDEACLAQLGTRSLSAHDFRRCFLPNTSALVSALCGSESPEAHSSHPSLPEGKGLREYVCSNATLYRRLLPAYPQLFDLCVDLVVEQEDRKCFLQWFFDMLPAPYDFDTSQLCVSPAPLLVEALHRLSVCEVDGGERGGWVGAVGYVLRVLDFVVGLSAGLDEGEGEVRQGLGQAILLSSLLDNASFWATLRPDASLSVLQTVGLFLRREQSAALKEDLLSCFSVSHIPYTQNTYTQT